MPELTVVCPAHWWCPNIEGYVRCDHAEPHEWREECLNACNRTNYVGECDDPANVERRRLRCSTRNDYPFTVEAVC